MCIVPFGANPMTSKERKKERKGEGYLKNLKIRENSKNYAIFFKIITSPYKGVFGRLESCSMGNWVATQKNVVFERGIAFRHKKRSRLNENWVATKRKGDVWIGSWVATQKAWYLNGGIGLRHKRGLREIEQRQKKSGILMGNWVATQERVVA